MTATLNPVAIPVAPSALVGVPAATISTALLLPQDRIAREPLDSWAVRLAAALKRCRERVRTAREFSGIVSGITNNVALMVLHGGDPRASRTLCRAQLRWQSRHARRSHDPEVAGNCVPPWVNLGRLESLDGAWQAALDRFAALMRYEGDGGILLGTTRVRFARGAAGGPRTPFESGLAAAYVIDSLRALLVNGRFAEVVAFAGEDAAGHRWWRAEATAVAACRLGDFDLADRTLGDALREARGWARAIFKLRRAEVIACAGDPERAAHVLRPVAATMAQVSPAVKGQLQSLYVLLRLAQACAEAGLNAEAAALGRDVYEGGCAAGDEVFRIEGLRILAARAPAGERVRWRGLLAELEETTAYRKYRRGGRPEGGGPLEHLCGELLELFAA